MCFLYTTKTLNDVQPGFVLTSMVKQVGNAAYDAFTQAKNGQFQAGMSYKGLKEGGVDWALDKNNRAIVPAAMEQRVTAARADIISGKIKVVDYRAAGSCPQ